MAERSEAKNAKRSFASKIKIRNILTRSVASRFLLRFAQPFLAKFKLTTNWSLSPQELILINIQKLEKGLLVFISVIISLLASCGIYFKINAFRLCELCIGSCFMLAVSATSLLLEERDGKNKTLVLADVYQKSSHMSHLLFSSGAKLRTPNMNPTFFKKSREKMTDSLPRNIVNKLFSL